MRVAVVIPWRGGQPDREAHHEIVRLHLERILPHAVHIDADDGSKPFSRAGSRNRGVELAEQANCDVVVLCDADTIPERAPLLEAIDGAADDRLHLPYVHYRGLSEEGTRDYLAGTWWEACETELAHDWATGGVLCITPRAWRRAGCMDERMIGYGFEDTVFRIAADALLGPSVRHEGTIVHLWHEQQMGLGSSDHRANGALAQRYVAAEGDPAAVKAIVAERVASQSFMTFPTWR